MIDDDVANACERVEDAPELADELLRRSLAWGLELLRQARPRVEASSVTRALDDFERLESLLRGGAIVTPGNPDLADGRNLIAPARHVVQHLLVNGELTDRELLVRLRTFLEQHGPCFNDDDFVFSADWFSKKCIPRWSILLQEMKGAPRLSFLEIGSFEGRSALWLLQNVVTHPSSRLTCVDLFPEAIGKRFNHNMARAGFRSPIAKAPPSRPSPAWGLARWFDEQLVALGKPARLVTLAGKSREVLRRLEGPFDFIYVDADHRPAAVLQDAVLAWPLLRPSGLMVFDDYSNPSTASGIDAFVGTVGDELDVLSRGAQLEIKKRGSLPPVLTPTPSPTIAAGTP